MDNLAVLGRSFHREVGRSNTDTGADQGMVYANDSRGRGKVVRPFLNVGKINSSSGSDHGKVVMVTLTSAYARACMFYDARFSSGFDFSLGEAPRAARRCARCCCSRDTHRGRPDGQGLVQPPHVKLT